MTLNGIVLQATLSLEASSNERAALRCKVEGNDEVLICSLREGTQETTNLDLILDSYTEFSLATKSKNSKASIHLAGYLVAEEDEDDGEMEGEEDEDGTCCDHEHHHGQYHYPSLNQQLSQI